VLFAFFAFGVFDHSLWAPNDTREAGMIWDLWRSGHWVALSLNGTPFLEKPPLLHWSSLLLCTLFGRIDEGLVRLPSALCGLGAVLIAYRWGRRLRSPRAGLLAAFLCATTTLYLEYSRVVLTDMCLTFVVALSLELFWLAWSAKSGRLARSGRFALFVLTTALAFYAKGLVGPGLVMTSVVAFLALRREWQLLLVLPTTFVFTLAAVVWPWAVALYHEGGRDHLVAAFVDNQLGRFLSVPANGSRASLPLVGPFLGSFADRPLPRDPYFVHKEPVYYYLKELLVPLLPWTLLVPPALLHWFRRRPRPDDLGFWSFLTCAIAAITVVLHVSAAKVGCYALPLFPLLFATVGVACDDAYEAGGSRLIRRTMDAILAFVRVLVVVAAFAYLLVLVSPRVLFAQLEAALRFFGWSVALGDPSTWLEAPGASAAWCGAGLSIAALALVTWTIVRDRRPDVLARLVSTVVLITLVVAAILPAYDLQRSYRPLAALVRSELDSGRRVALAVDEAKTTGALTFYADTRLPEVSKRDGAREFLLRDERPSAVVVHTDELDDFAAALAGVEYSVKSTPLAAGRKSAEFCLLTRN
jgi:4-amino-4-deoxy-L-arabinose transferase-like glycosyltransferase